MVFGYALASFAGALQPEMPFVVGEVEEDGIRRGQV
jgi:hypothetical protein